MEHCMETLWLSGHLGPGIDKVVIPLFHPISQQDLLLLSLHLHEAHKLIE